MSFEFLLTALAVILIPGTGVLFTLATGLGQGRRASIIAAFGCTLGITPHILASVLGVAAILHTSALLFQGLKYAGAAYLIWLAVQTLRDRGPLRFEPRTGKPGAARIVRTGFLINILNPKLSVFFLAFLPQFVPAGTTTALVHMLGLGAVFMILTFLVFVLYGAFAAWTGQKVLASSRVMTGLRATIAVVFAALGLRLALAGQS